MGEIVVLGNDGKSAEAVRLAVQPRASVQPPDAEEREQALDTTRSWIVEAPAGSGKTGLLIQRYLKLLAQPEVEQPEQVLAITFTLKAAGEIRERVVEQLERVAGADDPAAGNNQPSGFEAETRRLAAAVLERDRALGWDLLNHPRRLNVRTIDSICAEIARGLPVLSGGSGLTPVENASSLHLLAAERTMMQLGGADPALNDALSLVLLHRDGNLGQCRDLLAEMLALRDQWGRLIPLDRESLEESFLDGIVQPQLEDVLAGAISAELARLHRAFPVRTIEALSVLAGEMGYDEGYKGEPSPIAICAGRYAIPGVTAEDLDHWRALSHLLLTKKGEWRARFSRNYVGFEITKEQAGQMSEIVGALKGNGALLDALRRVAALPPAKYPDEQWKVAKALFRVLYRGLAELQVVFAERGECDFTELALLARYALHRSSGAVDTALGTKLQHMLVDEMQDTSTSQYELIELLTQGWDGRSQTVFLVGDPKQSIYLFRQARVERFICTMKELRLGELALGPLGLTANFRSQPGLVRSFNDDFSRLFPSMIDDERPDEAPYVAAHAVRGASREGTPNAVWHPQVVPSGLEPEEKPATRRRLARLEAQTIRGIIEAWRAKPLPSGRAASWKIAVLVRSRSHLTHIVAELKRDSGSGAIPFRAVDIEPLDERPEVLDLFALTRALLHPADRVAWLSVLRAPWCGLELAELHMLCGADDPHWAEYTVPELIVERGHELSDDSIRLLERIWPVLDAASRQRSRLPLSELVERTWRSLGGNAYLTEEQRTNARRYFELLDEAEEQTATVDLALLSQRLGQLYAAPATATGAVDLMTIHGAKGLEWDVVLLPGLERKSRSNSSRLLVWDEMTSAGEHASQVILAPIVGKGRDSEALNVWLNSIHKRREAAECKRLFYVACTRAREELHLFATPERKADQSIKLEPGSLLEASWKAAEEHFVDSSVPSKPLTAPVVILPAANETLVLPSLAAGDDDASTRAAKLYRLPMDFRPAQRSPIVTRETHRDTGRVDGNFARPEGSFESRAFGNAVHALMELLAQRLAGGVSVDALLRESASWQSRIDALLRNDGLSPSAVQRLVPRVQQAVESTLGDPHGVWVLSAHRDSASERAVTVWEEERASVRLDRVFRAGDEPFAEGEGHLWIIDFKTTQHTGAGIDTFLKQEREKYTPQMATYARIMRGAGEGYKLRMGLYYPMLPKLIWWTDESQ